MSFRFEKINWAKIFPVLGIILAILFVCSGAAMATASGTAVAEQPTIGLLQEIPYSFTTPDGQSVDQSRWIGVVESNNRFEVSLEWIYQNRDHQGWALVGERINANITDENFLDGGNNTSLLAQHLNDEVSPALYDMQLITPEHDLERFQSILGNYTGQQVVLTFSGYDPNYIKAIYPK